MGLFDTYCIPCPHCDCTVKHQKKPGMMDCYVFGKSPEQDLLFKGYYTCLSCKKSFVVEIETMPKMIVRKLED